MAYPVCDAPATRRCSGPALDSACCAAFECRLICAREPRTRATKSLNRLSRGQPHTLPGKLPETSCRAPASRPMAASAGVYGLLTVGFILLSLTTRVEATPHVLVWANGQDVSVLDPLVPGTAARDFMSAVTMAYLTRAISVRKLRTMAETRPGQDRMQRTARRHRKAPDLKSDYED